MAQLLIQKSREPYRRITDGPTCDYAIEDGAQCDAHLMAYAVRGNGRFVLCDTHYKFLNGMSY